MQDKMRGYETLAHHIARGAARLCGDISICMQKPRRMRQVQTDDWPMRVDEAHDAE
jgi:hypothetical protein